MPTWRVEISLDAEKDLKNLDDFDRARIIEKLEWLERNFESVTPIALGADLKGFYKFRVGDYRVIYKIDWDKKIVLAVVIGHRSKIYKN